MKVLIIGDVMIDAYFIGKVERISPEAPVPVVAVTKKENRLGGAANVALNIQSMGATPILCSVVGDDENAKVLSSLLKKCKMREDGILRRKSRTTTVKTRVIGSQHQMLRIDEEMDQDLNAKDTADFLKNIRSILQKELVNAIIFEDYDKGAINPELIHEIVALAKSKKIPVAVDPKHRHFNAYSGITLFKPNRREFEHGLKSDFGHRQQEAMLKAVQKFQKKQNIETMLVTLSEAGMLVSSKNKQSVLPAHIRSIADVSGAGDTVISVATLCLAAQMSPLNMTRIANLAGGLVCEHVGVVPIDKKQLLEETLKISFTDPVVA